MKNLFLIITFFAVLHGVNAQKISNTENNKQIVITHSNSLIIDTGTSISCNNYGVTHENSYYRVFDLYNDFFINADWHIENIVLGAAYTQAGQTQALSAILKFYSMSDGSPLVLDSLTLIGQQEIYFDNDDDEVLLNFDITVPIVAQKNTQLVIELFIPDGQDDENYFFIASNSLGQTDPSYIRAPNCDFPEPIDLAELGYPDMHIIMEVYGQYTLPNPEMLSFIIDGQITQTIITNDPDFTVSFVMPADSSLTDLEPEVLVPAGFQVIPSSGQTVDFSQGTVEYEVNNEFKKISQSWMVSIANSTPELLSFNIQGQVGETQITGAPFFTVDILMPDTSNLESLIPEIEIYSDFDISPSSGVAQDFTQGAVNYTVSHNELPLQQEWTVNVQQPSVIDENVQNELVIYPNPANEFIFLHTNFSSSEQYRIEIFNIFGSRTYSSVMHNNDSKNRFQKIDISQLTQGIYLLRVYSDSKVYSSKIIITE